MKNFITVSSPVVLFVTLVVAFTQSGMAFNFGRAPAVQARAIVILKGAR